MTSQFAAACGLFLVAGCAVDVVVATHEEAGQEGPVQALTAGRNHTCSLRAGRVRCWGTNAQGQLGTPGITAIGDDEPASAGDDVSLGAPIVELCSGALHNCALTDSGEVLCWGDGRRGKLGHASELNVGDDEEPLAVGPVALGQAVTQISCGRDHTCALGASGVICWGMDFSGVLGHGTSGSHVGDDETPASVGTVPLGLAPAAIQSVHAGARHNCVVTTAGTVMCWGENDVGQLGVASTESLGDDEPASARLVAVDHALATSALEVGEWHSCVLDSAGRATCWGSGQDGRLGYAGPSHVGDDEPPSAAGSVPLGGSATEIAAGLRHTCALIAGEVRCFGDASNGQLGNRASRAIGDDEPAASSPLVELGRSDAVQLAAGDDHTCAAFADHRVVCWGLNDHGQLGYGHAHNVGDDETPASEGPIP